MTDCVFMSSFLFLPLWIACLNNGEGLRCPNILHIFKYYTGKSHIHLPTEPESIKDGGSGLGPGVQGQESSSQP